MPELIYNQRTNEAFCRITRSINAKSYVRFKKMCEHLQRKQSKVLRQLMDEFCEKQEIKKKTPGSLEFLNAENF